MALIKTIFNIKKVNGTDYQFSFTLAHSAQTSAGVYRHDGQDDLLVRTLWSGEAYAAGNHLGYWDGKDDYDTEAPNGNYIIKLLENRLVDTFEGAVGNNSTELGGETIHHSGEHIACMTCTLEFNYYGVGYAENEPGQFKFLPSDPWHRIKVIPTEGLVVMCIDHDDTKVYWAGCSHTGTNCIMATNRSNDAQAALAGGTSFTIEQTTYTSAINIVALDNILGLAVQKTGNFIVFSQQASKKIKVYNKGNGAIQEYTAIADPRQMCFEYSNNHFWLISGTNTVGKYAIDSNGVINPTPVLTLSGLSKPLDVKVDPVTGTVSVQDAGAKHQVRKFNPTTGAESIPLGQEGGYVNNPLVADNKFHFGNTKKFGALTYGDAEPYLAYQPDGTLWVGDLGNLRSLHFNTDSTLNKALYYIGYHYSVAVCQTNPTRVFANYLEYRVDESIPFGPHNGSWKLYKNWSYHVDPYKDQAVTRMFCATTLANGRTYALSIQEWNTDNSLNLRTHIIELVDNSGIRYTPVGFGGTITYLDKEGNIWQPNGIWYTTQIASWKKYALTGFSGNNPVYSAASTPISVPSADNDPVSNGWNTFIPYGSDKMVSFSKDKNVPEIGAGNGFHLGLVKNGKWLWKGAPSTHVGYFGEFPLDGSYDIGNFVNNSGSFMNIQGDVVVYAYYGEGWKGKQTNKYNFFHAPTGLFLKQIGMVWGDAMAIGEATPGMAGNALSGNLVQIGNDLGLYHADEFFRGGVSRRRISALDTIQVHTKTFTKTGAITLPPLPYVDLMAGLPKTVTDLVNNTAGWSYTPATYDIGTNNRWAVKTRTRTYRRQDNDILFESVLPENGQTRRATRDLGTINAASWRIEGEMLWVNPSERWENFLEVLDAAGKVIFRLSRNENYPQLFVRANGTTSSNGTLLVTVAHIDRNVVTSKMQPFSFATNAGVLTVKYAGYSAVVTALDFTADITKPKTLRVHFYAQDNSGKSMALKNLRFYSL